MHPRVEKQLRMAQWNTEWGQLVGSNIRAIRRVDALVAMGRHIRIAAVRWAETLEGLAARQADVSASPSRASLAASQSSSSAAVSGVECQRRRQPLPEVGDTALRDRDPNVTSVPQQSRGRSSQGDASSVFTEVGSRGRGPGGPLAFRHVP